MKKIFASIIALMAIVTIAFPTAAQSKESTDGVKKVVIKVGNLHCNNDMPTIKKQLLNQDGVEEVAFTAIAGASSIFTITYHGAATSQEQIEKAIEATPGCDDKSTTPYKVKKEASGKKKKS
ncbi:heavy-metal-associated domain-containing protein [Chitinophaga defluvii]|uniref:HMA domain-containing protein n=1 Tax=Chitinophaga defluvii TaxID=3163343 RepID=A0ABV2T3T1_9BACT